MKRFILLVTSILSLICTNFTFAQINTGSPKVPFGSQTKYPNGIMPSNLPTSGTYGKSQDAADFYNTWKTTFVEACSVGSRVKFDNTSQTVSEGIAYGMLLSAYAGDKTLFDNLWKYYLNNKNGNGVMNWQIGGCSGVIGANGATDAELDAAMALIIASEQWPNATSPYTYKNEALYLLGKIKQYEIHPSTYQTLNGDAWGTANGCRNPSYFAPGYYREFANFDAANKSFWTSCATTGCDALLLGNRNSTTGLVSNWCSNTSPYSDNNCNNTGTGYGADACRNPWRMATDVLWHGSSTATTAYDICSKLTKWLSGYEAQLKGPVSQSAANPSSGSWQNGTYSTFGLAPMAVSTAQSSLDKCYTNIKGLSNDNNYFNQTIRCVTMFVLTGNFWKPGASGTVVAPTVLTATTNSTGSTITVNFTKAINTPASSENGNFSLYINGSLVSSAFSAIAANGTSAIDLTVKTAPKPGDVLTLSYTPGAIKSTDGGVLAAFTGQAVDNALAGNSTLVDDCEDADSVNFLMGKWFSYSDVADKGASTVTPNSAKAGFPMTAGGANGSAYCAHVSYTLNKGSFTYDPYIGIGTATMADTSKAADWTGSTGLTFWYKGAASSLNIITPTVTDYGFHYFAVPACTAWTKLTLKWSTIVQPTWAVKVTFDVSKIKKIQWQVSGTTGATGDVYIDDVQVDGLVPKCTAPTVSIVASKTAICNGNSVILTAGGTASTYAWSNGATTAAITVSPTTTTTYTVTGSSATGGCSATASQAITVNAAPTIAISPSTTTSVCAGSSATLTASGAASYIWSTTATTGAITVSPTVTTSYSVTGTDANNCVGTATKSVTVNPVPTVSVTPTTASICEGTGTSITASGATTYTWSTNTTAATINVTPSTTTTYTVTGTSNGCSATASASITVNAKPSVSITPSSTSICSGTSTTLSASGATSYSWSTSANTNSITVSPSTTTIYTVTGTENNCSNTATANVMVSTAPSITISATKTSICEGENTIITASGANSYSWDNGSSTPSITVSPATTTTYNVTGTVGAGCYGSMKIAITVNASPSVTITPTTATLCNGTSTGLTASGANSYVWSNSSTLASISVTPTITTTYSVTGTSNGCSASKSAIVTVNANPQVSILPSSISLCNGETALLKASGASNYIWSTSETTESITAAPTTTTTYSVTGTDVNGCKGTASSSIVVNNSPIVSISPSNPTICSGSTQLLTASGASSYIWSNGNTSASQNVSPTSTTTYSVTGSNAAGCKATASTTVTVSSALSVSITPSQTKICKGLGTTLKASGASNYIWSNSGSGESQTVNPSSTTTYSVTGSDASGCNGIASATVTVVNTPTITVSPVQQAICEGESLSITASGGTDYIWSNGNSQSTQTVSPTINTNYTVTGTDLNGCSATAISYITVNPKPNVAINTLTSSICNGLSATLSASGATSYTWSTSATTSLLTVTPSTTTSYSVTGTSAGCSSVANKTIVVNQPTSATISKSDCNSVTVNNETYTTSGVYTQKLTNIAGCDSTLTINVSITDKTTNTITETACSSYTLNNQKYTSSGTYYQTIKNSAGCDSVITLILTINNPTSSTLTEIASGSYTLNGTLYDKTGVYTQNLTNKAGCDSTITLNLTIQSSNVDTTITACNSILFNGKTYDQSGDYTINIAGGGVISLHLTILKSSTNDITITECDSYTLNGKTYNESGDYVQTFTNKAGCDSIINLHLTVKKSTTSILQKIACNSFTLNTTTYDQSGVYSQKLTNKAGCDSTITLYLTINKATQNTVKQSGCDSLIINGSVYYSSGSYKQTLTNKAGCDSIVTYDVTVNKSTTALISATANGSYTLNGKIYTAAGTYTQKLNNKAGCDSTITLILTMVDLTNLNHAIDSATTIVSTSIIGLDPGQYPQSAQTDLQSAINKAKAIAANPTMNQTEINIATSDLLTAISVFYASKNGSVDKTALLTSIVTATKDANNATPGTNPGNYPQSAIDELNSAISTAKKTYDNSLASAIDVSNAKTALDNAITIFLSKVIQSADFSLLKATIASATTLKDQSVIGDHPGQYPASAISTLENAIASAEIIVKTTNSNQKTVDDATQALKDAIDAFKLSVIGQPDKTNLNQTLATAIGEKNKAVIGEKPGNYPAEAVTTLSVAIQTAQTVSNSTTASQKEVDDANTTLKDALASFYKKAVGPTDKTELEATIANANNIATTSSIGDQQGQYPQSAKTIFDAAILSAQNVDKDPTASVAEVAAANDALKKAITTFLNSKIISADKTQLASAITIATNLLTNSTVGDHPGQYTSITMTVLENEITAAQSINQNPGANQKAVNDALATLNEAIDAFKKAAIGQPDKTLLSSTILTANTILGKAVAGAQPGQYPQSAINDLGKALNAAQNVESGSIYSQSEVNSTTSKLEKAIADFNKQIVPDAIKDALNKDIELAKATLKVATEGDKPTQYPSTNYKAFNAAITAALSVYNDPSANQTQVDIADNEIINQTNIFVASQIPLADPIALNIKIIEAETIKGNTTAGTLPTQYPQSEYDALTSAIAHAHTIAETATSTQAEINNEINVLNSVLNKFKASEIPLANKTELKAAIDNAMKTLNSVKVPTDYTLAAVEELYTEITEAESIMSNQKATQTVVDNETKMLNAKLTKFINSKTFISEISNTEVTVGPIPTVSDLNIHSEVEIKSVSLFDINGRLIQLFEVNNTDFKIETSSLNSGSYLLIIKTQNNNTIVKTFVK